MIKVKFVQYPNNQDVITFDEFVVSQFNLEECAREFLRKRAPDVFVTDTEVEEFLDECNTNIPTDILKADPNLLGLFYDNTTVIFRNTGEIC